MKKLFKISVMALLISGAVMATTELAKVNGQSVTDHDLTRALTGQYNESMISSILKDPNNRRQILENVIDRDLVIQQAEKDKFDQTQEYKDMMENAREQYLYGEVMKKVVDSKTDDSAVKKFYQAHKEDFSTDEVHAQHILVGDEATARDVLKKAQTPNTDFQELAVKYSKDPTAKNNRGDLGFFNRTQMVEEFTTVAFRGKPGQIIGPVKTAYGYHIIKIIERKPGKVLEFSDVEQKARQLLQEDLARTYVTKLRTQAKISMDEKNISNL